MTWQLAKIMLGIAKNPSLPESSSNALTILDLKTETPLAWSQLHFFLSALSKFIFSVHFYKCNLQRQMNHVSVIKRHQKKDISKNKEEHVRDFHFKKHEIRFSLGVLSHFHCSIQKVSAEANKFARTYRIDVRFQGHFSELMIIVIDTSSHLQRYLLPIRREK